MEGRGRFELRRRPDCATRSLAPPPAARVRRRRPPSRRPADCSPPRPSAGQRSSHRCSRRGASHQCSRHSRLVASCQRPRRRARHGLPRPSTAFPSAFHDLPRRPRRRPRPLERHPAARRSCKARIAARRVPARRACLQPLKARCCRVPACLQPHGSRGRQRGAWKADGKVGGKAVEGRGRAWKAAEAEVAKEARGM